MIYVRKLLKNFEKWRFSRIKVVSDRPTIDDIVSKYNIMAPSNECLFLIHEWLSRYEEIKDLFHKAIDRHIERCEINMKKLEHAANMNEFYMNSNVMFNEQSAATEALSVQCNKILRRFVDKKGISVSSSKWLKSGKLFRNTSVGSILQAISNACRHDYEWERDRSNPTSQQLQSHQIYIDVLAITTPFKPTKKLIMCLNSYLLAIVANNNGDFDNNVLKSATFDAFETNFFEYVKDLDR